MVLFSFSFILPCKPPCEFLRGVWVDCHSCGLPLAMGGSTPLSNTGQHTQHSLSSSVFSHETHKHNLGCHNSKEEIHSHKDSCKNMCINMPTHTDTLSHSLVLGNVSDLWGLTPLPYFFRLSVHHIRTQLVGNLESLVC